jgi:hypothetical protein
MVVTQEIFEAFLQCPTKSYLSSHPDDGPEPAPGQARQRWEEFFRQSGLFRLRAAVSDHEVYTGTPTTEAIKQQQYRMILGYTVLTTELRAHLHGLELVHLTGAKNRSVRQYVPIRFLSAERISTADKFLLAFDALAFSQATSTKLPHVGKLIHGWGYSATTVALAPL